MAYISGSEGCVEIDGTRLDVRHWRAEETADCHRITGTGSPGFAEALPAARYLTGTVRADFDPAKGPKGAVEIRAGATVQLVLHTGSAGSYTMNANIVRLGWVMPAGKRVSFSFDFESTGSFSYGT